MGTDAGDSPALLLDCIPQLNCNPQLDGGHEHDGGGEGGLDGGGFPNNERR